MERINLPEEALVLMALNHSGVVPKQDKVMDKNMFNLHLKEYEFRFNNRKQNIYRILLGIFRKESLKLS
jgi:hypothetical protein